MRSLYRSFPNPSTPYFSQGSQYSRARVRKNPAEICIRRAYVHTIERISRNDDAWVSEKWKQTRILSATFTALGKKSGRRRLCQLSTSRPLERSSNIANAHCCSPPRWKYFHSSRNVYSAWRDISKLFDFVPAPRTGINSRKSAICIPARKSFHPVP